MAATDFVLAGLLAIGATQAPAIPDTQASATIAERDRVEVLDQKGAIRGRVASLMDEVLVIDTFEGRVAMPVAGIRRIDRVGDSLANGAAIGAGIGGGSTLALMAKLCTNTGCADTSANLDPRIALLGTLIGAGIGTLIDAAIESRSTVYSSGAGQAPGLGTAPRASDGRAGKNVMVFGRLGWARVTDDEGWLGNGASAGAGIVVPIGPRLGVQVAYDRHTRSRDFEYGGGFFGTEQLLTAKALFFFRPDAAVRPYAAFGLGMIDSRRRSEFPTFTPGFLRPVTGPPEILHYHSRDAALGFGAGFDAKVTRHVSVLGDLTLDIGGEALGSTRLTVGAGYRF
jgi:hypothetical protein